VYDRAEIRVKAGNGGYGVVSFRREKFVPFGGPDGGDGGDGGDVIIRAEVNVTGLREYVHRRSYRAENGKNGSGSKKYGKGGTDLVLSVPIGTVVLVRTGTSGSPLLADLSELDQQVVVAKGGRGGKGNVRFASSTNQVPRLAQAGDKGEEKELVLELKLLADVGIIGYPNAGKSTLLALVSAARPKVASYPFTTLEPVLGVVEVGNLNFIMAEIPDIIEGAHAGKGLGHDFLRHVERTKVLLHLVDGGSVDPAEDMARVNMELALYDSSLAQKLQIVVINKIDLPEVRPRMAKITEDLKSVGISPLFISAATGGGISELLARIAEIISVSTKASETEVGEPRKVFRPLPKDSRARVQKRDGIFVVVSSDLERIVAGSDVSNTEVLRQLMGLLARSGVNRTLEKAGVKPGDTVRCGNLEWKW
jgi:GTPase